MISLAHELFMSEYYTLTLMIVLTKERNEPVEYNRCIIKSFSTDMNEKKFDVHNLYI